MKKSPTTQLIPITFITLVIVLFGGACSSNSGSDPDPTAPPASDLANHPLYSNYNFGGLPVLRSDV